MINRDWKFNVSPLILKFSHNIDADKIVLMRTKKPNQTLLGQLEDAINEEIERQKKNWDNLGE